MQNGENIQGGDTMSQSGDEQIGDTIQSGDTMQNGESIQRGDIVPQSGDVQNGDTIQSGDTMQNGENIQGGDTMSQSGDEQIGDTIQSGDTIYSGDIQNGDSVQSGDTMRQSGDVQNGDTVQSGDNVQNDDRILSEWSHYTPITFLHQPLLHYLPSERFIPLEFSGHKYVYLIPTERSSCPARLILFNLIASTITSSTNCVTSVHFFTACSSFLSQVEISTRAPFRQH